VERPGPGDETLEGSPNPERGFRGAPCWLRGEGWEASLGLSLLLGLGGLLVAAAGSRMASSVIATAAVAMLIILWDKPLARLPLIALLAGIDAGAIATSSARKVVLPPIVVERGPYGSSVGIDPIQIIVALDIIARVRACSATGETLKTPSEEEPLMVPR